MDNQNYIVETNSHSTFHIFIFLIVFIVVVILIGGVIWWFCGGTSNVFIDGDCNSKDCCSDGLFCDDGKCKVPIGGHCDKLSQCVNGSTACFNGICTNKKLGDIGESPPCMEGLTNDRGTCKVPVDGECNKDRDCVNSAICLPDPECDSTSSENSSTEFIGICVERKRGLNSKCNNRGQCDHGYTCDNDICKIDTNSYIPCRKSSECLSRNICIKGVCEDESTHKTSHDSDDSRSSDNKSNSNSKSHDKSKTENNSSYTYSKLKTENNSRSRDKSKTGDNSSYTYTKSNGWGEMNKDDTYVQQTVDSGSKDYVTDYRETVTHKLKGGKSKKNKLIKNDANNDSNSVYNSIIVDGTNAIFDEIVKSSVCTFKNSTDEILEESRILDSTEGI